MMSRDDMITKASNSVRRLKRMAQQRLYRRTYSQRHKVKLRARHKLWRNNNRDVIKRYPSRSKEYRNAVRRKWRKQHPVQYAAQRAAARLRRLAADPAWAAKQKQLGKESYGKYGRAYYQKTKVVYNAKGRVYWERTHEAANARRKETMQNNPDLRARMNEQRREWKKDNPDKAQLIAANSQAKRQLQSGMRRINISVVQWRKLSDLYDHVCAYCRMNQATSLDHIIPLARCGEHVLSNIVPACGSCNSRKNRLTGSEFILGWTPKF